MSKSKQYYIRKAHRWLGVLLGIQFIFWTAGGIYFSWSNMDEIHGDFQKSAAPLISSDTPLVSPSLVMQEIKKHHRVDSIVTIQLIEILGRPTYQIRCVSNLQHTENNKHDVASMNHLADAVTGQLRGPLTQDEAIAIAQKRFNGDSSMSMLHTSFHLVVVETGQALTPNHQGRCVASATGQMCPSSFLMEIIQFIYRRHTKVTHYGVGARFGETAEADKHSCHSFALYRL